MNAILKVNSRGTLTLPKPLREALGVSYGGTLVCDLRGCDVVLQPDMSKYPPIEMYTDERIAEFEEDANSIGDKIDKFFEKMGWEYDPETWSIHEKSMVCETQTPYVVKKPPEKKKKA